MKSITEKSKDNIDSNSSNQVLVTADLKYDKSYNPNLETKENERNLKTHQDNNTNANNETRNPNEDYLIGLDIKQKCTNIFFNYAKYSTELKEFFVSNQTIINLLKTLGIYNLIQKSELDLILNKVSSNTSQKITIVEFMNFLILLTKKLYPVDYNEDQVSTMVFVIKQYFEPLSKYIENKQFNQKTISSLDTHNIAPSNNVFHQKIFENVLKTMDNREILIIRDILPGIGTIYSAYFNDEMQKVKNKDRIFFGSLNNLIEFTKDFELTPYLFGVNQLVTYWNYIVNIKKEDITNNKEYKLLIEPKYEKGELLTLSKFCALILHLGVMYYNKNKSLDLQNNKLSNAG